MLKILDWDWGISYDKCSCVYVCIKSLYLKLFLWNLSISVHSSITCYLYSQETLNSEQKKVMQLNLCPLQNQLNTMDHYNTALKKIRIRPSYFSYVIFVISPQDLQPVSGIITELRNYWKASKLPRDLHS